MTHDPRSRNPDREGSNDVETVMLHIGDHEVIDPVVGAFPLDLAEQVFRDRRTPVTDNRAAVEASSRSFGPRPELPTLFVRGMANAIPETRRELDDLSATGRLGALTLERCDAEPTERADAEERTRIRNSDRGRAPPT
jgi:hypothetical protein